MPTTATDLLKKMLAKAGVTYDGDLTAEIPDEVATSLDNQLLTIAAATNNHPDVKKVYFAQAYNGLDAEIKDLVTEFGLSEEIKAEIEKAGGSTKKAVALVRQIKALGDKAVPADSKKHADEVRDLRAQLALEVGKQTALKTEFDEKVKQIEVKTKLSSLLGGYKTVFDDLDPAAKDAGIQAIITKALQDSDADFTFDEKGNLSLVKKDGTNLFGDNHTLVTPQSFVDKSLSKILKVTGAQTPKTPANPVDGAQNPTNSALKSALAESLQNYEAASKNGVPV